MLLLETLTGHRHGHLLPGRRRRCCPGWCRAICCRRPVRDQPAGHERRADGRRRSRGPVRRGVRPRAGRWLACGVGMLGSVPMLLSIRAPPATSGCRSTGMLRDLREGWSEFRSHTWLWVIVAQFGVILMAWYGGSRSSGPWWPRPHLGGPAAWGAITAAESVGLIVGGIVSLRFTPRRPMLFVAVIGAAVAISPLLAGDAMAAAGDLPGRAGPRHHHGDHDGAVDRGPGPAHPAGQAGPRVVLRRDGLGHGHADRRADRRPAGRRRRSLRDAVRRGRADPGGLGAGPDPARHTHHAGRRQP